MELIYVLILSSTSSLLPEGIRGLVPHRIWHTTIHEIRLRFFLPFYSVIYFAFFPYLVCFCLGHARKRKKLAIALISASFASVNSNSFLLFDFKVSNCCFILFQVFLRIIGSAGAKFLFLLNSDMLTGW